MALPAGSDSVSANLEPAQYDVDIGSSLGSTFKGAFIGQTVGVPIRIQVGADSLDSYTVVLDWVCDGRRHHGHVQPGQRCITELVRLHCRCSDRACHVERDLTGGNHYWAGGGGSNLDDSAKWVKLHLVFHHRTALIYA